MGKEGNKQLGSGLHPNGFLSSPLGARPFWSLVPHVPVLTRSSSHPSQFRSHPNFSRAVPWAYLYLSSLHPSIQLSQKNIFLLSEHPNNSKGCDQTRFLCLMCSKPNAEMLRFAAEKGFTHETVKWENGKTNLKTPCQRRGARDIYGIKLSPGECGGR